MAKPRLRPLHYWIVALWFGGLVGFVLNFLSINQGGGWLEGLVAPMAAMFFLGGSLVIGVAAGIARFLLSGPYLRAGILLGVPGIVALWLASWG